MRAIQAQMSDKVREALSTPKHRRSFLEAALAIYGEEEVSETGEPAVLDGSTRSSDGDQDDRSRAVSEQ